MSSFRFLLIGGVVALLSACGSHPILPEKKDIQVSRDNPKDNCKSLGSIEGRSTKIHGTAEDALDDMKAEAIKKGANFIKMETIGALGSSVRGEAFFCP